MCGRAEAIAQWLDGDEACMVHAEEQARALVATWLLWLRALATEVPPTLRIDLLLTRAGPGRAELHTLELTEAGFSLLGWRGGPAKVTGATSPLYLPHISPIPPLHLPHTSPISPPSRRR